MVSLPALILSVVLLSGFPPQESRPFEPFRRAEPMSVPVKKGSIKLCRGTNY